MATRKLKIEFAGGSRIGNAKAQVYGEEFQRIHKKRGKITRPIIVEEAEPEDAVFHGAIPWDADEALRELQLIRAGDLLRCVRYRIVQDDREQESIYVRAYSSVPSDSENDDDDEENPFRRGEYQDTLVMMENPRLRAQLVEKALAELNAWRLRHAQLEELAKLMSVIAKTAKKVKTG